MKRPGDDLPIALEIITDTPSPVCVGCASKPCSCKVCRNCQQSYAYANAHDCPADIVGWTEKQNVAAMLAIPPEFLHGFQQPTHQDYGEAVTAAAAEPPEFKREVMGKPVPIRWTLIDGELHVEGQCCSPSGHGGSRCPKDGGRVHKQGVYGGMAYCCERCEHDAHYWQTGPLPESDRAKMQRELAERCTIDPDEARKLLEDEEAFKTLTNAIEKPKLSMKQMFEQIEKAPLRPSPIIWFSATQGSVGPNENGDIFAPDALKDAFDKYAPAKIQYIPGRHKEVLQMHLVDLLEVSMGLRATPDVCSICNAQTCEHFETGPIAFAPWRPLTTQEKIELYASGQKLPYPLHDECLFREFGTTSKWSRECVACMAEHDTGDEDPQLR